MSGVFQEPVSEVYLPRMVTAFINKFFKLQSLTMSWGIISVWNRYARIH